MITEKLYTGADNTFTLQYSLSSGTLPTPTRVEFTLNGTTVNSVDNPEYFSITLGSNGQIEFDLGGSSYTRLDSGHCTIRIFDAINTDGVIYTSPRGPTKVWVTVI